MIGPWVVYGLNPVVHFESHELTLVVGGWENLGLDDVTLSQNVAQVTSFPPTQPK